MLCTARDDLINRGTGTDLSYRGITAYLEVVVNLLRCFKGLLLNISNCIFACEVVDDVILSLRDVHACAGGDAFECLLDFCIKFRLKLIGHFGTKVLIGDAGNLLHRLQINSQLVNVEVAADLHNHTVVLLGLCSALQHVLHKHFHMSGSYLS